MQSNSNGILENKEKEEEDDIDEFLIIMCVRSNGGFELTGLVVGFMSVSFPVKKQNESLNSQRRETYAPPIASIDGQSVTLLSHCGFHLHLHRPILTYIMNRDDKISERKNSSLFVEFKFPDWSFRLLR